MVLRKKLLMLVLAGCLSPSTYAVICMASHVDNEPETLYLAANCQYFSGSKELRINRQGALSNYNSKGNYNDQLYGQSYIYCPILEDEKHSAITTAEIKVSDLNQQQDIVCQMGRSSYTQKGFAAYWGKLAKSQQYGEQTLVASTHAADDAKQMQNSFITCSLPPQDRIDDKASSLVAYSVKPSHQH